MKKIAIASFIGLFAAPVVAVDTTAYWRFEAAGGSVAFDSGPNGLDGAINALPVPTFDVPISPVPGTGELNGRALDLNWQSTTSGGRFNVVDPGGLLTMGNTSFTIEAWVRLDMLSGTGSPNERQYLCQKKSNAGPDTDLDYAFIVQAGDLGSTGKELALRYGDGATAFTLVGTLEITDTNWHHVSLAYDADANNIRFGIDGTYEVIPFTKPNHTNAGPLRVGAHQNGAGDHNHFLRGTLDEMRIASQFVPAELLLDSPGADCNSNGIGDAIDILSGASVDCNGNCIPDECDIDSGASADCQGDGIPDECQLDFFRYAWEDGEGDAAVRSDGAYMAWVSNHRAETGFATITHVDVAMRYGPGGDQATAYVWSDPNGDGDPADAVVLSSQQFTISEDQADLNNNSLIDVPDVNVGAPGTSFFVGVVVDFEVGGDDFPARYDLDDPSVPGVDWVIGALGPIDPNDLSAGAIEYALVENAGLPPGNWTMQAVVEAYDCNANGIPDECDIANGAVDCNNNGLLDLCEIAYNDCNLNGIPDDCDITAGTSLDLDLDGVPDECPLMEVCVPNDTTSIQQALNVVGEGGVVTVKDGTYFESIGFRGRDVTLISENGPGTTTIDAGEIGPPVVKFTSGEGPGAVIDGFTLTGGLVEDIGGGGGIVVGNSAPIIRNNVITGNGTPDTPGGGILLIGNSAPTIEGNTITGNIASEGAGIWASVDNDLVLIRDNVISNNTTNGGLGGGMLFVNGTAHFLRNVVEGNTGAEIGGGITLLQTGNSPSVVASNVFRNNQSIDDGGGMWLSTSNPLIVNNLVVGNTSASGAGVRVNDTAVFANNTVIGNTATQCGGGIFDGGSLTIVNSIVRDNVAPSEANIRVSGSTVATYSNIGGGFVGIGNIDADPQFVDAGAGDYRLASGSPSIDSGSNSALPEDIADLDGDRDSMEPLPHDIEGFARTNDDPNTPDTGEGTAPIVDMGAYEWRVDCQYDLNGDATVDFNDLVDLLANWGMPYDFVDLVDLLAAWGDC